MEVTQSCRRHWTMLVELVLTVTLSAKMGLVSNLTPLGLTVAMLSIAISKRRVKHKGPVSLQEQPLLLHLTPALVAVPTLQVPALLALVQPLLQALLLHHPWVPLPLPPELHRQLLAQARARVPARVWVLARAQVRVLAPVPLVLLHTVQHLEY